MKADKSVVFLHMPKCAGSSMKKIFQSTYKDRFRVDYTDNFFQIPQENRYRAISHACSTKQYKIEAGEFVYGHFFPFKYIQSNQTNSLENRFNLITFLRDPIDRLASHYTFFRKTDHSGHYLWRKMIKEDWSFARFALSTEMKDFYSQYLFQVPICRFDFLGIHENLARDWTRLIEFLDIEHIELPLMNQSYSEKFSSSIPESLKKDIRNHHSQDYYLYEYARSSSFT